MTTNTTPSLGNPEDSIFPIYNLLDLQGKGNLVEEMKRSLLTRNMDIVEGAIRAQVKPFLYNEGHGRKVSFAELVIMRNEKRTKAKLLDYNKDLSNPDLPKLLYQELELETLKAKQIAEGKFRLICWDLNKRGSMGETCLHICFLCATQTHMTLAKKLLKIYPKLINDIYVSEEYYGENVLHMAVVNEDPIMVKFLLDQGVDFNQKCDGHFFTPEDQKKSRSDDLHSEGVVLAQKTNYRGHVYLGEYAHCFAACLGQEECYRIILAKGVNVGDHVDANGNNVLHILIIKGKMDMFDTAYELGASTNLKNRQGFTALTLAALLARKQMFFHILNLNRDIYWRFGNIASAAYPLEGIDTIHQNSGEILPKSALNLIAFGETEAHVDLLDGVIVELLKTKWNSYVKSTFYWKFVMFTIYFGISLAHSLMLLSADAAGGGESSKAIMAQNGSEENCWPLQHYSCPGENCLLLLVSHAVRSAVCVFFVLEAGKEARYLGRKMFLENMLYVPTRIVFLLSCGMVMLSSALTMLNLILVEDMLDDIINYTNVFIMLATAPYFLFFCRGVKIVGPFVIMIYRMITKDLLRFVIIYAIFTIGFSQAYFVMFRSYEGGQYTANKTALILTAGNRNLVPPESTCGEDNPMQDPVSSLMSMFIMSLNKFDETVCHFDRTDHPVLTVVFFLLYMTIATILLVNMLIAMMGNTYQVIAERRNEWMRQWARIVLIVERGISPQQRLKYQEKYSEAMSDGSRALVLRLKLSPEERQAATKEAEIKKRHQRWKKNKQANPDFYGL